MLEGVSRETVTSQQRRFRMLMSSQASEAGVFLTAKTGSSRTAGKKRRRDLFLRGNGKGGGLKEERKSAVYWYGKRQQAILIRPIQP